MCLCARQAKFCHMPPELHDEQLLRSRDADVWDTLYRSTSRRTYRVLHHVTGAMHNELEELNQDVWLSAIQSVERFDATRGTPQDWVLGIARFKGLTYLRKKYYSRFAFVSGSSELAEHWVTPDSSMEFVDRIALLRAAIESLPENWQYLLRQKYEAGLSVNEIAELIAATPKAVESTLSRARQRLRDLFRETIDQSSTT